MRIDRRLLIIGFVAVLVVVAAGYVWALGSPTPALVAETSPSSITDARGVPMVLVPAGAFMMGVDLDPVMAQCDRIGVDPCELKDFIDAAPAHLVTLGSFYIDTYEVTNERYAECVADGGCAPPSDTKSYSRSTYYGDPRYAQHPVILVSWYDARDYCGWRGARLPTEAEWEKSARGADGRFYPWGTSLISGRANFCDGNCSYEWADANQDDGYADTAPVGSYPEGASPYGVQDMAGNVWEWVSDRYDAGYYLLSPPVDPQGPSEGEFRVAKGGAWFSRAVAVAAAYRLSNVPTARYHFVGGFRCALPA